MPDDKGFSIYKAKAVKKKHYFAIFFLCIGIAMGFLALKGLEKVGFDNKGMPIQILLGACVAFIVAGLAFIIFGKQ